MLIYEANGRSSQSSFIWMMSFSVNILNPFGSLLAFAERLEEKQTPAPTGRKEK
jgi:hypothetical protein